MSEQGRVDLERLRRVRHGSGVPMLTLTVSDIEALVAVVDDALWYWRDPSPEAHESLTAALEPFTPAGEGRAVDDAGLRQGEASDARFAAQLAEEVKLLDVLPERDGRVFNERMQERERARRVAALGIELVDGDEPMHISPSGPAPSRVDAEQARRDAEWWLSTDAAYEDRSRSVSDRIARHCLALLAELEQAAAAEEAPSTGSPRWRGERAQVQVTGLVFNERMQERERARVLADLGIEVVPRAEPQKGDLCTAPGGCDDTIRGLTAAVRAAQAAPQRQRAEQAERERDDLETELVRRQDNNFLEEQISALEARLARVPALVEALREFAADDWDDDDWVRGMARAALAGWEQA